MTPELRLRVARRRRRRFLFVSGSLGLYAVYSLQWVFDVRGWIEHGLVTAYFPIILFALLITGMCVLEIIYELLEDHRENRPGGHATPIEPSDKP